MRNIAELQARMGDSGAEVDRTHAAYHAAKDTYLEIRTLAAFNAFQEAGRTYGQAQLDHDTNVSAYRARMEEYAQTGR